MSTRNGWPRRQRTAMRVGGWSFVTVGVGHAVLASLLPSTGDAADLGRRMETVHLALPPSRSYADLMEGFSLAMSVLLIVGGWSVLLMTRQDDAPARGHVVLSLGTSLALLGMSLRFFPAPPIVLMAVASGAFAVALDATRRIGASVAAP